MLGEQVHSAAIVLYVLSVFPFVVEHTETNGNCFKDAKSTKKLTCFRLHLI